MRSLNCTFLGFGNAARAFTSMLARNQRYIRDRYDTRILIRGISTATHGRFLAPDGLTPEQVLTEFSVAGHFLNLPRFPGDTLSFLDTCRAHVVFEMTPLNPLSGQPAIDHVKKSLLAGSHVVSANKGPLAWAFDELSQLASRTGRLFLYETCVMDGLPLFNLVDRCLPGCRVTGFSGVLNSTTNFILDTMMAGSDFSSALAAAQQQGFTESDPTLDIEGHDPACKTAALMNAWMDANTNPARIPRDGISGLSPERLRELDARGLTLRLVCRATSEGPTPTGEVRLLELPASSPMANVHGTTSLLRVSTDLMGDITLIEHDPGIEQTGYGLYSDLLRLLDAGMA